MRSRQQGKPHRKRHRKRQKRQVRRRQKKHQRLRQRRQQPRQEQGQAVYSGPAGERSADLSQRLPTYEDVLALDKKDITAAGYEERDGQPCVYVASNSPMGYTERWWISANSGLLVAVETEKDGELVYAMSSRDVVSPLDQTEGVFVLPDGTELYRSEE